MRTTMIAKTLAAVLVGVACATPGQAQEFGNSLKVQRLEFPVSVAPELNAPEGCALVGYLHYHGSFRERPLQVAVHGATYNHTYWDFPRINGADYSYVRYMIDPARKYAVLAIDQLGAGESCKPANGLAVTLDATASALAQAIDQLRSGNNPTGYAFPSIVLVGHSAGSINAIYVQAKWHPADALVITAARHISDPLLTPGINAVLPSVPFLETLSYFALPSLTRTGLFYYPPGADPSVIAADNATADQWTGGQVASTFFAFVYPVLGLPPLDGVDQVTGPVLIQLGQFDALFPAGAPSTESALWTNAHVTMQQIDGVGHDFNLHLNRLASWQGIDAWLRKTLTR